MSQRDPQARSPQQCDRMQGPPAESRPPKVSFQDTVRILQRLRRPAPWTWPSSILLVILSHSVLAQAGPALATDVTPRQMQSGSLLLRMKSGYVIAMRMHTSIEARRLYADQCIA